VRFFLDNNLSPAFPPALSHLSQADGCTVQHLSEKFKRNIPDEEWLPELSKEGGWVVVSGDLRIFKSPHLRRIWIESKLTAFFLAKGWMNKPFWEQAWWLVRWWPHIMNQASLMTPGYGFEVPAKPSGKLRILSSPPPTRVHA
jgi:PIN domain-containing protein